MRAVIAPRCDFFLDCRLYGKYGRTASTRVSKDNRHGVVQGGGLGVRTGDFVSRTPFARRDKDQELHDAIIYLRASRLDHENVLLSNTGEDLDAGLALMYC